MGDLSNPVYRKAYVAARVRRGLAASIRQLRGDMTQERFAEILGKPQNVVSRLESPLGTGTVQTLIDIANALNLGLVIKFVSLDDFKVASSQSPIEERSDEVEDEN